MSFSKVYAYRTRLPNGINKYRIEVVAHHMVKGPYSERLEESLLENLVERLKDDLARLRAEDLVWEEK